MAQKPSKAEEEYFARTEAQRHEAQEIQHRHEEREERRRLHYMKCPKCGADLETTLFRGVEVDRCNECEGVWLDRGELEKLAGHETHVLGDFFAFFRGRRD